jgi:hypothetical protein
VWTTAGLHHQIECLKIKFNLKKKKQRENTSDCWIEIRRSNIKSSNTTKFAIKKVRRVVLIIWFDYGISFWKFKSTIVGNDQHRTKVSILDICNSREMNSFLILNVLCAVQTWGLKLFVTRNASLGGGVVIINKWKIQYTHWKPCQGDGEIGYLV